MTFLPKSTHVPHLYAAPSPVGGLIDKTLPAPTFPGMVTAQTHLYSDVPSLLARTNLSDVHRTLSRQHVLFCNHTVKQQNFRPE
jgi:hypothetical protein